MARAATLHRLKIDLSDVDRGVYEKLDLRIAQHPSETARRVMLRAIAYALSYADGIEFSKGGLSDVDEPPIAIRDAIGVATWIEVDSPSVERLKKACTTSRRVLVFTCADGAAIAARLEGVPRAERAEVFQLDASLLDALVERAPSADGKMELVRSGGTIDVTCGGATVECELAAFAGA